MISERMCCCCRKTREVDNVVLHRFPHPHKDPERFRSWVFAVGGNILALDDMYVYKYRRVCHLHFETCYWTRHKMLSNIAKPTLHLKEARHVKQDHNYFAKRHCDHSYAKLEHEPKITAEKTPLDDEDWRETSPAYRDNKSSPRQHAPAAVRDVSSPYNTKGITNELTISAHDKFTNDQDMAHGIDPSILDEFEEPPTKGIFSWQKEQILYPTEDTDVLMCPRMGKSEELRQELGDVSLYDDPDVELKSDLGTHQEYRCNACEDLIKGFRYTCVQCADWDLCGACEARAAHAAHYVLRVPGQRAHNEIQAVLAAIRQQLLSENLFLSEPMITEDGLKSEPEEEEEARTGEGEGEEVGTEPDPLRAPSADDDGGLWGMEGEGAGAELDPLRAPSVEDDGGLRNIDEEDGGTRTVEESEDEISEGSSYSPPRRRRRRPSASSDSSEAGAAPGARGPRGRPVEQYDELRSEILENQDHSDIRRKPVTRSASNPVKQFEVYPDTEASTSNPTDHRTVSDVLELPDDIYQVSNDMFEMPDAVFEGSDTIFEIPAAALAGMEGIWQVSDDATVFIQKPDSAGSLDKRDVLRLRVPPDTDDAALAQALQSQAYVVMQPNLEVPDNVTACIQDSVVTPITGASLEQNEEVLHLRVPPDTDDAALAQALQSQAYVVMQPLAIEEVIDDR